MPISPVAVDLEVIVLGLSHPQYSLEVSSWLILAEERAHELIASRDSLYLLLSSIQRVIDSSSRPTPDSSDHIVSDTVKAQALVTYTSLIVQFPELAEQIRPQFIRALADMIFRRNLKRKDYVNSFLRGAACECLSELELASPGEVSDSLDVRSWLLEPTVNALPAIIQTISDECLPCSGNYSKLLLHCAQNSKDDLLHEKALMKIVSLLLDSVEFASSWLRGEIATNLSSLVRKANFIKNESVWTFPVVNHHFSRLLDSSNPHQVHSFLKVAQEFQGEWDPYLVDRVVDRIYEIVRCPEVGVPIRVAAVVWLCELLEDFYMKFSVYDRRARLLPIPRRDPDVLIEAKLQGLVRYARAFDAIPKDILRINPHNWVSMDVTFRFIVCLLNDFCPKLLNAEKTSLLEIPSLLNELLASNRSNDFLPSIISVVQLTKNPECRRRLLRSLGDFLNSAQPPAKVLTHYFGLVAFLACSTEIDSRLVLSALKRFKAEAPQWIDGLKYIEICRLLIITHSKDSKTVTDIVNLLRETSWWSLDIEDRAHCLIRVVESVPDDVERKKFLVPCSEDTCTPLSVVSEEVPSSECTEKPEGYKLVFSRNGTMRKTLGISDDGFAVFDSERRFLILPFNLHCEGDVELFSIELTFSVSGNHQPFGVVTIPYITGAFEEDEELANTFPYRYNIELHLRPLHPVPATFSVFAVFTDRSGKSHEANLDPFRVSLEDLFLPVQTDQDIGELWRGKWHEDIAFSKLLSVNRERLKELVKARLAPFIVPDSLIGSLPPVDAFDFKHELLLHSDSVNEEPLYEETAVIIHLPPEFHLMMRFVMGKHTCVVWIATDRTDVLSLLDSFFENWI
jgi:hypothetical protein